MTRSAPVLEITGLTKDYHGLRPLRIEHLLLGAGEQVALVGLDAPMAETLVNLVTGATLPDTGAVEIFGRSTASIADADDWLTVVDRIGIVSERTVLLEQLSVIQNLAMPLTLDIDPPADAVRQHAERLALEVGAPESTWPRPVAEAEPAARLRVRIGRALALDPGLLLLEHPGTELSPDARTAVGSDLRRIALRRRCALVAVTADAKFAAASAGRVLALDPVSGRLSEPRRLLGWFRN